MEQMLWTFYMEEVKDISFYVLYNGNPLLWSPTGHGNLAVLTG